MKDSEELIKEYEKFIRELNSLMKSVSNSDIFDWRQKNKFITFLDKAEYHCIGTIQVLNGSYKSKQNKGKDVEE